MALESLNPINGGSFATAAMSSAVAASSWSGRTIAPLAAAALTVVALASLLPSANAYGYVSSSYHGDLGCDYDFYGTIIKCCHLEEVCAYIASGFSECQLEEVCNYF